MKPIWPTKKLGEVCEIVKSGVTPFDGEKEYIDTNSVQNFSIVKSQAITYTKRPSRANMEPKTNDVLVAKMADTVKVYLANSKDEERRIFSTGFFVLRPKNDLILPNFLFFYCASNLFQSLKDTLARGSTQKALNNEKFRKYFEIPLPALKIQKRIVTRIKELFEKIDKAKELREKAREETEQIFQSAMHEVFSKAEKKWNRSKLKEVVREDKKQSLPKVVRKLPYIGMEDIESETGKLLTVPKPKNIKSTTFIFNRNHVLYGKLRPYLNKVFVPNFEGHCTTEFIPLLPNVKILLRNWLAIWLQLPRTVNIIMRTVTGTRMPRANMKDLFNLEIPLPPLSEQKKIVAYLDNLREKVEKLKQLQQEQLGELEELKKSILNKAFKGEL